MISLTFFALFGLANADVSLSTRQNDAQFERRQTVSSAGPLPSTLKTNSPAMHARFLCGREGGAGVQGEEGGAQQQRDVCRLMSMAINPVYWPIVRTSHTRYRATQKVPWVACLSRKRRHLSAPPPPTALPSNTQVNHVVCEGRAHSSYAGEWRIPAAPAPSPPSSPPGSDSSVHVPSHDIADVSVRSNNMFTAAGPGLRHVDCHGSAAG